MKRIFIFLLLLASLPGLAQVDTSSAEKKARYRYGLMRGVPIYQFPNNAITNAFKAVTDLAVGKVPFLTHEELRAGKADTARVVLLLRAGQVWTFMYDSGSSADDDTVSVIKAGSRTYVLVPINEPGSQEEVDPTVSSDIKAISPTNISNWNTSFGWGDHAAAGYASVSSLNTGLSLKEPSISTGTTSQYWRGDKQWALLDRSSVDLSNVDNTSDANKPVSTATSTALSLKANSSDLTAGLATKEPLIAAGLTTQYRRGDNTWQLLDKTAVGLSNADNTSDASKPISSATQTSLNSKEATISAGTTSQYYRGDKSWQTLDKSAVGLPNVDNTSDANKPVSSAAQTALNLKANDNAVVHNTGTESSIAGLKTFTNNLTVAANILFDANGTRDVASSTNRAANVWSTNFFSPSSVRYGTTNQAGNILWQFGTSSQLIGGFQATTGEAFFQGATTTPTAVPTSQLSVHSTTKGVLLPRMTTAQKNAISSPAEGLEVYDLDLHAKCFYNGTIWKTVATL